MLLVCLNSTSATQEAVRRSSSFVVNILAEHQGHIAERFARPGAEDKFAELETRPGRTGAPLLPGVLATVECRVAEVVGGAPIASSSRRRCMRRPRRDRRSPTSAGSSGSSSWRRTPRCTGSCARWSSADGSDPTNKWTSTAWRPCCRPRRHRRTTRSPDSSGRSSSAVTRNEATSSPRSTRRPRTMRTTRSSPSSSVRPSWLSASCRLSSSSNSGAGHRSGLARPRRPVPRC